MSHFQTLAELKKQCDTTGDCTQYQTQLQHEERQIDTYTASANQSAVTSGLIVAVIGLIVLLTPFIKTLQRLQKFSLPKIAVALPVLMGLVIGLYIGFMISFSACFKQECSAVESTAIFTAPVASLIVTIPIAIKVSQRKQLMVEAVSHQKPIGWVVVGALLLVFAVAQTAITVNTNLTDSKIQKIELQNL